MVEPAPLLVLYASQTGNAQVWISVGIESRSRKAVPASSTRQAVLRRRAAAPPPPPALASAFPSQSGPLQHPLLTFLCPGRCGAHWPRGAEAPLCAARAARRRLPTQRGQPALCACARVCGQHHGPGRASRQHAQPVALPAAQEPAARLAGRRAGSRVWAGRLGVRVRVRVLGGGGGMGGTLRSICGQLIPAPCSCPARWYVHCTPLKLAPACFPAATPSTMWPPRSSSAAWRRWVPARCCRWVRGQRGALQLRAACSCACLAPRWHTGPPPPSLSPLKSIHPLHPSLMPAGPGRRPAPQRV